MKVSVSTNFTRSKESVSRTCSGERGRGNAQKKTNHVRCGVTD